MPLNITGFANNVSITSYFANGTVGACGAAITSADPADYPSVTCTVDDTTTIPNITIVVTDTTNSSATTRIKLNGTDFWPVMYNVLTPVITVGTITQTPAYLNPLGVGAVSFTVRRACGAQRRDKPWPRPECACPPPMLLAFQGETTRAA